MALQNGLVRPDPYYDGQIFHRVISNFVIQTGSPAGTGSDGPGFAFRDEFSTNLTHHTHGILSMANSGQDSNGSQFFVTLRATPNLDFDKPPLTSAHAVFGQVISGMPVVSNIAAVATGTNDKPLTNVVIEAVTILREGPEAEAFDVHAWNLPQVGGSNLTLRSGADGVPEAVLHQQAQRHSYLAQVPNLAGGPWTLSDLGLLTASGAVQEVVRPLGDSNTVTRFATASVVHYLDPATAPPDIAGWDLAVTFAEPFTEVIAYHIEADGSGTYTTQGAGNGTVDDYYWTPEPYRSFFGVVSSGLFDIGYRFLQYETPTSGTFNATVYSGSGFSASGTFTATPIP